MKPCGLCASLTTFQIQESQYLPNKSQYLQDENRNKRGRRMEERNTVREKGVRVAKEKYFLKHKYW